jgi:hypothetical protein
MNKLALFLAGLLLGLLCGVLVPLPMPFVSLGRFSQTGIGHVVVIAILAE